MLSQVEDFLDHFQLTKPKGSLDSFHPVFELRPLKHILLRSKWFLDL